MYYINATPTETGYYGNPQSNRHEGSLALPEELLSAYLEAKGYIVPTVEDKPQEDGVTWPTVTALEVNREALEAYEESHPDVPPEDPEPTLEERNRADIDYIAVMSGIDLV